MARSDTKTTEMKYVEKLNISTLSISGIKNLIKRDVVNTLRAFKAKMPFEKNTWHIIGPAGVGKTQICFQIANEITDMIKEGIIKDLIPESIKECEIIMIKSPVLSRDDMIIPFPVIDNGKTSFKMLYSDFVPMDEDTLGLFVIDEFSRGDHAFQQLMWQVQNEYKLHLTPFPKYWFVISVDNPDDQEYSMDMLEDAAGIRRMIHIYTEVNPTDFIKHAQVSGFHPVVIEYIQSHPDRLYDFESQKKGSVYANPASFEKLSDHMKKFDLDGGFLKHVNELEIIASVLINTHHTRLFMEFAQDQKDVSPKDVFNNYDKVRKIVKQYVKDQNNAKLGDITIGFVTYLTTSLPKYGDTEKGHIAKFLTDIPIDTAAIFITNLDKLERDSEEYLYITKLHMQLIKDSNYKKNFYEKLASVLE